MRTLLPAPDAAFDSSGEPRLGSFYGGIPRVDLSPMPMQRSLVRRTLHHKRWMYVALASEDTFVALCVIRFGYAASTFAFAYDRKSDRMLVDRSSVAPPYACEIGDAAGEGCVARYRAGRSRVSIARGSGATRYAVDARLPGFELDVRLETAAAPPAITAIARLPGDLLSTTEKRTLLTAEGGLVVEGRRRALDGALAGYDYTNGMLARHTAWQWAFLLGRARTGEKVALNLVQGFVGEPECAAWIEGEVHPLAEGRFAFERESPMAPWRVSSADGAVDLTFRPGGIHAERKNLGVVTTRFLQPVGTYSGRLRAGGRDLEIDRALGVAEDQDARW
jgi:hypothetical protein